MYKISVCSTCLAVEQDMRLLWYRVCGGLHNWVYVNPNGKRAPSVFSSCAFAPREDVRNPSVLLSLKTASNGSKH